LNFTILDSFVDYADCPMGTSEMRSKPRVYEQGDRIYIGSTYVRCDLGAIYCSFKIKNLTNDICAEECLFLNYRYAGTMNEYPIFFSFFKFFFI